MKIRMGFVTNSSSSNFASASTDAILGALLGILLGGQTEEETEDENQNESQNQQQAPSDLLVVKVVPNIRKLELGNSNPISLFAQARYRDNMGVLQEDKEASQNIEFDFLGEGDKWVTKSDVIYENAYKAIAFIAETPYADLPRSMRPPSPDHISVAVKTVGKEGKPLRRTVKFELVGEPKIEVKPAKVTLLNGSEEIEEFQISVLNAGVKEVSLDYRLRGDAEKYITAELEKTGKQSARLRVKALKSESIDGYDYNKAVIELLADVEGLSADETCEANVYYEGLYYVPENRENPAFSVIAAPVDGSEEEMLPESIFDLRLATWDDQQKCLVYEAESLVDVEFDEVQCESGDEALNNLLDEASLEFEPREVRESNMKSRKFAVRASYPVPGKSKESIAAHVMAYLDTDLAELSVKIPLKIIPEFVGDADWQQEYENCVHIVKQYYPDQGKAEKLSELETLKSKAGLMDLRLFREKAWIDAYYAIAGEADRENRKAALLTAAIYTCEVSKFMGDRAFEFLAGSVTGPLGSFVAGQVKDFFTDFVVACMTSDKDSMEFVEEYLGSRIMPTAASGIDATVFANLDKLKENKKQLAMWLVAMLLYKWAWHYFVTKKEEGTEIPLGVIGALEKACGDMAGVGVGILLGDYVGKMIKSSPNYPIFNSFRLKVRERKALTDAKKALTGAYESVVNDEELLQEMQQTIIGVCINR